MLKIVNKIVKNTFLFMKNNRNLRLILLAIIIVTTLTILTVLSQKLKPATLVSTNTQNSQTSTTQATDTSTSASISTDDFIKIKDCFSQTEYKTCLDNFVTKLGDSGSTTKEMLAAMEAARTQDTQIENQCHDIAHAIGRYTYKKYTNIGDAFNACDQSCHSGCYHGVMERMFYSDQEINSKSHLTFADIQDKIPDICSSDKFSNPTTSIIFQCLHGVGHAVMFSLDYDLEDSLKACDLLPTQYDQSSCYGGVFMENVTAFDKSLRDLKADDPLYPCNKVAEKYKNACYLMQTSVMFEYGLSNDEIIAECKKSEQPATCFVSLGRDLSNFVRTGQMDYVTSTCESLDRGSAQNCIDGTVYALSDNTWDGQFSFSFCSNLKDSENKNTCFRDTMSYIKAVYAKTSDDLKDECTKYGGNSAEVCKSFI